MCQLQSATPLLTAALLPIIMTIGGIDAVYEVLCIVEY